MRLHPIPLLFLLANWLLAPSGLSAAEEPDSGVQQLQLEIAALYERLNDWEQAEKQLLAAAGGPSAELRERALEDLERVRQHAERSAESPNLELAWFYERRRLWREAEKHYLAAAAETSEEVRRIALEGLERVRPQMPLTGLAEDLEPIEPRVEFVTALLAKGLAVVAFLAVGFILVSAARGVIRARRQIEVLPFVANSSEGSAQIDYWLGRTRARCRAPQPFPGGPAAMSRMAFPYLRLPGLADHLPELDEVTLAGTKLPAGELLRKTKLPRVRVTGGWVFNESNGRVFAEFERRKGISRYEPVATIEREIPAKGQEHELELFAYDVLIQAARANAS